MKTKDLPLIYQEVVDGKKVYRQVGTERIVDEERIEFIEDSSRMIKEGEHYILFGRKQIKMTEDCEAPKGVEAILLLDIFKIGKREFRKINYLRRNPLNGDYPLV